MFKSNSGGCAAFLGNYDEKSFAKVSFGDMHYNLPPWSISILPDCKHTVYNTARVRIKWLFWQHYASVVIRFPMIRINDSAT